LRKLDKIRYSAGQVTLSDLVLSVRHAPPPADGG
jgi:hypothetical protein